MIEHIYIKNGIFKTSLKMYYIGVVHILNSSDKSTDNQTDNQRWYIMNDNHHHNQTHWIQIVIEEKC